MMARVTHVHTIDAVARRIGENLELIEIVSANPDNIDYGEMIWVDDGTDEGIKTFTDRGIEGKAASVSSCATNSAIPKSSRASWLTRRAGEARRPPADAYGVAYDPYVRTPC
jgi:hypothetical protein